jgi:hypothetical protein
MGSRNQTSICRYHVDGVGPMFAFGRTAAPETDYGGIGYPFPCPVPERRDTAAGEPYVKTSYTSGATKGCPDLSSANR